jgi:hypothetical protein
VKADVAEGQERQAATLVRRRNGSRLHLRDSGGQKLAYVYFEDEPGRRSAAKLLTRDEARRISANIATLPVATVESLISIKCYSANSG